jgi:hypothetical protein
VKLGASLVGLSKKHAMSKIATPAARDTAHIARRIAQRKMRGFAGPTKAERNANRGRWRERLKALRK